MTRALFLLFVAGLALAGCNLFNQESFPCPKVSLLGDASRITLFAPGAGRDLTDVTFEGEIEQGASSCDYSRASVANTVPVRVVATRGAAAPANQVTLPFFLAVIDKNKEVLARERFETTLQFQGNQRRSGAIEQIEQVIPIRPGLRGFDYEIIIGFELEPEQLQYNRRRRGLLFR
ncbi:MAG: hypothetical protein EXQ85_01445 [Alphaproteobacteria bacterium]|nr:hypothetical protein [Alphaproteobacteria bacterium]